MISRSSLTQPLPSDHRRELPRGSRRLRAPALASLVALCSVSWGAPAPAQAMGGSQAGSPAGSAAGYATRLTVAESPKPHETLITVSFTNTPTYIARFSDEKRRFIVDVMDADVRGLADTYSREVGIVKSVLT